MKKGLFITVEGGDGSGKTTQLNFMKEFLSQKGVDAVFTREPGGTDIGEKIRDIILDPGNKEMEPVTEVMLYAAARAQHVRQVIKPALAEGKVVLCDRFLDSSTAYQGCGRGLEKAVEDINFYAVEGCMPDVTFLFRLDPETARKRISEKEYDRLESEALEFHRQVYEAYLKLERENPDRIIGIDGGDDPMTIKTLVEKHLERLLKRGEQLG